MNARGVLLCLCCLTGFFSRSTAAPSAGSAPPVPFAEVLELVRAHLKEPPPEAIDQAALEGLIKELKGAVILAETARTDDQDGPPSRVAKTDVFDNAFGYARLETVGAGLGSGLATALASMAPPDKLKGLVLDLRFASGTNYEAVREFADMFLPVEQDLLSLGGRTVRGGGRAGTVDLPLVVLVNRETKGVPEVLAALARERKLGVVIGERSAGQARAYRDFRLSNGQTLRVASGSLQPIGAGLPDGPGVVPDITVPTNPQEERRWLDDPYDGTGNRGGGAWSAAPPRRRLNEADLVRMMRRGVTNLPLEGGAIPHFPNEAAAQPPVVRDPSLGRALDLLRGLSVVRGRP